MPKVKISEFSATPASNTDIDGINIAEGCAPSGINDAIRELMAQLKDFQAGTAGDSFNGPVGTSTAAAGAFTTLAASGAVTLSGGTANGVPYLNGSKVVTSGSALTFDGTNLGVGTSSPGVRLSVDSGSSGIEANFNSTNASGGYIRFQNSSTSIGDLGAGAQLFSSGGTAGDFGITSRSGNLMLGTGSTERARIDTSGNLLVGATSANTSSDNRIIVTGTRAIDAKSTGGAAAPTAVLWNNATTGDNIFVGFRTETADTQRGSISYNRSAGLTAYNTTSDYRAKDIIGPVTNSGALIDSVPVYMGKMKDATQERPMFIAHEVPAYAHTGEKDAVDADGNPVYQQMDASALIPVMWAEIQSLRQRLAAAGI